MDAAPTPAPAPAAGGAMEVDMAKTAPTARSGVRVGARRGRGKGRPPRGAAALAGGLNAFHPKRGKGHKKRRVSIFTRHDG